MDSHTVVNYMSAGVDLSLEGYPVADLVQIYNSLLGNANWNDSVAKTAYLVEQALEKRDFDPNTGGGVDRDKLPASDFIDPKGRRFPIVKPSDVSDAVSSYGRANPKIPMSQFRSRLIAIARRKGPSFVAALPKSWNVE